jgi:dihydroflavonol-4-reductase
LKVAVTGATGHLGANLIRALLVRRWDVRAVTIESPDASVPALDGLDVERVQADVCDPAAIDRAVRGAEIVFHLAGRISIAKWEATGVWAVNVDGTRNVVEACISQDVRRLVHVSSIHALDPNPRRMAVLEDREPSQDRRLGAYDRSKAAGERIVLDAAEQGLEAVVLNPTGMIGPWDVGPSLFGRVLLDIWQGRMKVMVDGGMNWVDVRDVAEAAISASTRGRAGARYLLGGSWVHMEELATMAAQIAGVSAPPVTTPMWLARLAAPAASAWYRLARRSPRFTREALGALERYRLVLDSRANDELDHRPRRIEQTLEDTYEWFAEAGSIIGHPSRRARRLPSAVPSV